MGRIYKYSGPQVVVFWLVYLECLSEGLLPPSVCCRRRAWILEVLIVVGRWLLIFGFLAILVSIACGLRRVLHLWLHWISLIGLTVAFIVVTVGLAMGSHACRKYEDGRTRLVRH